MQENYSIVIKIIINFEKIKLLEVQLYTHTHILKRRISTCQGSSWCLHVCGRCNEIPLNVYEKFMTRANGAKTSWPASVWAKLNGGKGKGKWAWPLKGRLDPDDLEQPLHGWKWWRQALPDTQRCMQNMLWKEFGRCIVYCQRGFGWPQWSGGQLDTYISPSAQ